MEREYFEKLLAINLNREMEKYIEELKEQDVDRAIRMSAKTVVMEDFRSMLVNSDFVGRLADREIQNLLLLALDGNGLLDRLWHDTTNYSHVDTSEETLFDLIYEINQEMKIQI